MSWFSLPFLSRPKNSLPPYEAPKPFSPLDISDCFVWLDAADTSSVVVNKDTSGNNVDRVMKWFDKAKPSNQNYFHHVGSPSGSGLYGKHFVNKLPAVYFEPYSDMDHQNGGLVFPFQARTFFCVTKPLTNLLDISGTDKPVIGFFNGYDPGAMNTAISYDSLKGLYQYAMCENSYTCGLGFDLSNNPVKQRMLIMFAQSDSMDLSGNAAAYDTVKQPLSLSDPADQYDTSSVIQYELNNQGYGTAQDMCEILLYGRLLTEKEQTSVLDYLADKWNLSGLTPD